jgi:hypothetical protein
MEDPETASVDNVPPSETVADVPLENADSFEYGEVEIPEYAP